MQPTASSSDSCWKEVPSHPGYGPPGGRTRASHQATPPVTSGEKETRGRDETFGPACASRVRRGTGRRVSIQVPESHRVAAPPFLRAWERLRLAAVLVDGHDGVVHLRVADALRAIAVDVVGADVLGLAVLHAGEHHHVVTARRLEAHHVTRLGLVDGHALEVRVVVQVLLQADHGVVVLAVLDLPRLLQARGDEVGAVDVVGDPVLHVRAHAVLLQLEAAGVLVQVRLGDVERAALGPARRRTRGRGAIRAARLATRLRAARLAAARLAAALGRLEAVARAREVQRLARVDLVRVLDLRVGLHERADRRVVALRDGRQRVTGLDAVAHGLFPGAGNKRT